MYNYEEITEFGDVAREAGAGFGAGFGAAIIMLFAFIAIIVLAVWIFAIVAKWKMFEKAGKPGWAAIIPVYSTIVTLDIIGYKWYYIFLFLLGGVPVIGQIALLLFTLTVNVHLARSFGQSIGFGIGLCLISPVFNAIIAFKKDIKYVGKTVNGDIDFNDLF